MDIKTYLTEVWMTPKQAEIFLTLYRLGAQPASVIARNINQERTITYKSLLTMVKQWFLSKTTKNNVLIFFVNNIDNFREKILQQQEKANQLANKFPDFLSNLQQLQNQNYWLKPSTTLYDWTEWLKNLQQDMINEITINNYRIIKRFWSHLYDTQSRSTTTLEQHLPKLFSLIEKEKIWVNILLGKWISLIEQLFKSNDTTEILNLPTGTNAINIIIIGQTIYILIFEPIPSAIKISHPLLANTFHFLFEQLEKK